MKMVEQFKRRILDLAIRGKLVPQDPNDESASVLLERIREERAELVKAGKIKKDKQPSRIVIGSEVPQFLRELPSLRNAPRGFNLFEAIIVLLG